MALSDEDVLIIEAWIDKLMEEPPDFKITDVLLREHPDKIKDRTIRIRKENEITLLLLDNGIILKYVNTNTHSTYYVLTDRAYAIKAEGGWRLWLEKENKNRLFKAKSAELQKELHESTLATNNAVVNQSETLSKNYNLTLFASVSSLVLSGIATAAIIFQQANSSELPKQIESIKTTLQELQKPMIEIKQSIDALPHQMKNEESENEKIASDTTRTKKLK